MRFIDAIEMYKNRIEKELYSLFDQKVKQPYSNEFLRFTYCNLKEYIMGGGKRLRPISLIMAYFAVSNKIDDEIIRASLSVELLHNSTLVHDDIMDEDEFRRNKPTIHKKSKEWFLERNNEIEYNGPLFSRASSRFAITNAICNGNVLFTLGLSSLLNSKFDRDFICKAIAVYNDSYNIVNDGQIIDNLFEFKEVVSEKEYYGMIEKKTGNLFLASIQIGALLGNATYDQYNALSDYAKLAIPTFQLQDDIIAITKKASKERYGSDIRKGKKTLLIIKALERADDQQRVLIRKVLGKENAPVKEIDKVVRIIEDTGSLEYVKSLAGKKIEEGKKKLINSTLNKEAVDFFMEFADYMVKRDK